MEATLKVFFDTNGVLDEAWLDVIKPTEIRN